MNSKYVVAGTIAIFWTSPLLAEPTFEETRQWIMSKFNKYNNPWVPEDSDTVRSSTEIVWSPRTKSANLEITPCSIKSLLWYSKRVKYDSDSPRLSFRAKVDESYSLSDLSSITNVTVDEGNKNWNSGFPHITLHSSYKAIDHHENSVSGSRKYRGVWSHEDTKQKWMKIYFRYQGGEPNLEDRVKSAFLHLSKLAKANPICQKSKEAF